MKLFTPEEHKRYEELWIAEQKQMRKDWQEASGEDNVIDVLGDDEYIDYQIWNDIYIEEMYKKHLPNNTLIRGKAPNLIFHGGCLGCLSQRLHGVERCKGCRYFRHGWEKKSLFIEGEKCSTLTQEDLDKLLGNE